MIAFNTDELCTAVQAVPTPVVVFVTDEYEDTFRRWLVHAAAARILPSVVALAGPQTGSLVAAPARAVRFDADKSSVLRYRTKAFVALLEAGLGFIHSDADAFWLSDAREDLAAYSEDLVYSQGTIHPVAAWRAWGFVACCGLFRAHPRAVGFFRDVLAETTSCDQESTNQQLMRRGVRWVVPEAPEHTGHVLSREVRCWKTAIRGLCPDGLSVAVLPMREYQRICVPGAEPRVIHHLRLP